MDDILTFYKRCIRSVLDYAAPVFHTWLPKYLMSDLKRILKRPLSGESYHHDDALYKVNIIRETSQ